MLISLVRYCALALSACVLSCGGSGSSGGIGNASSSPLASTVSVAGQAVKGPVSAGTVCAYTFADPRIQITCSPTDSTGYYSMQLPLGISDVLLEVTGGTYVDEATGQTVSLQTPLRTLVNSAKDVSGTLITPFTELAVAVSQSGLIPSRKGFDGKISELESALGLKGLTNGNPFGGGSADDKAYLVALTSVAKLQLSNSQSLSVTLQNLKQQLEGCSGASVVKMLNDTVSLAIVEKRQAVAASCVDSFVLDGVTQSFALLSTTPFPSSWASALNVSINSCGNLNMNSWPFTSAVAALQTDDKGTLVVNAPIILNTPKQNSNNNFYLTSNNNFNLTATYPGLTSTASGTVTLGNNGNSGNILLSSPSFPISTGTIDFSLGGSLLISGNAAVVLSSANNLLVLSSLLSIPTNFLTLDSKISPLLTMKSLVCK
jgi:hypothetical protein